MPKVILIIIVSLFFISCSSAKRPKVVTTKKEQKKISTTKPKMVTERSASISNPDYNLITNIVNNAKEYNGVRYKYGGTTSKGMDCSGLICKAFESENIALPRTSLAMSKHGSAIDLDMVQKGDLLFFQTNKNKKVVNHVGLVVESLPGVVEFIHSTSSKGVIISNLNETYWRLAFHEARRVL